MCYELYKVSANDSTVKRDAIIRELTALKCTWDILCLHPRESWKSSLFATLGKFCLAYIFISYQAKKRLLSVRTSRFLNEWHYLTEISLILIACERWSWNLKMISRTLVLYQSSGTKLHFAYFIPQMHSTMNRMITIPFVWCDILCECDSR